MGKPEINPQNEALAAWRGLQAIAIAVGAPPTPEDEPTIEAQVEVILGAIGRKPMPHSEASSPLSCTDGAPCCDRRNEYNGFGSDGPLSFICPRDCPCHD